ncbi:starvation-inducible DNA-binding protein [Paenibacillus taihuensis]|uniref:Starvation-inducible DNA-binding protein n=1 Tax=Paenibacillus taihuensis TaxID=1156355 RepID=A0A3D9SKH7_9BACL|nr:Dps family protein [Paenibacillus taihuensis]REE90502.1 starvation-inducible DNA-binding protein [Paenibacillus taihuensis]
MTTKLQTILNNQIATWSVLYVKLHNFHWYVKGNQFFTLHVKFQELYEEATLHVDEIAERLLAIGGQPVATMAEYIELSTVKEATGKESAVEMVDALIADFSAVVAELKEGMAEAASSGDETSGDMLLAIHSTLEKHIWMLKAFNGR